MTDEEKTKWITTQLNTLTKENKYVYGCYDNVSAVVVNQATILVKEVMLTDITRLERTGKDHNLCVELAEYAEAILLAAALVLFQNDDEHKDLKNYKSITLHPFLRAYLEEKGVTV